MNDLIHWVDGVDQAAFKALNAWLHRWAVEDPEVASVLRVANEMGNGWALVLFLVALIALEDNAKRAFRRLLEVGAATLGSGLLSHWLKKTIERPRPQLTLPDAFADGEVVRGFGEVFRGASFPSGHTATAFAVATVFAWWAGGIDVRWRRVTVRIAVFAIASITGVARVYGGAHYPLDVVGGAAMGVGLGLVVAWLSTRLFGPYRLADAPETNGAPGSTEPAPRVTT